MIFKAGSGDICAEWGGVYTVIKKSACSFFLVLYPSRVKPGTTSILYFDETVIRTGVDFVSLYFDEYDYYFTDVKIYD